EMGAIVTPRGASHMGAGRLFGRLVWTSGPDAWFGCLVMPAMTLRARITRARAIQRRSESFAFRFCAVSILRIVSRAFSARAGESVWAWMANRRAGPVGGMDRRPPGQLCRPPQKICRTKKPRGDKTHKPPKIDCPKSGN